MEVTHVIFTKENIDLLHANLNELREAGKIGNAHSIAVTLDEGIKRYKEAPVCASDVEAKKESLL